MWKSIRGQKNLKKLKLAFSCSLVIYLIFFLISTTQQLGLQNIFIKFWVNDYTGVAGGWFRIIIYSILFIQLRLESLLFGVSSTYETFDKRFYKYSGFSSFFKNPPSVKFVKNIEKITKICWVFCIFGFGGIFPPFLVSFGVLILYAVFLSHKATSHRYMVLLYCLFGLAFTDCRISLSVDKFLMEKISYYPFPISNEKSIFASGFGIKFCLVACIFSLFMAGVEKLLNGGWKWMNGHTLKFNIYHKNKLSYFISHSHPLFLCFLSVSAIVFELAAIFTLFSDWIRVPYFLVAVSFHVVVWFVMLPNFTVQCLCYLIITWGSFLNLIHYFFPSSSLSFPNSSENLFYSEVNEENASYYFGYLLASHFMNFYILFSMFVMFLKIEYFPITCYPMYSLYRGPSYFKDKFKNHSQLVKECKIYHDLDYSYTIAWGTWAYAILKHRSSPDAYRLVSQLFPDDTLDKLHFRYLFMDVICEDTLFKLDSTYLFGDTETPSVRFCKFIRDVLQSYPENKNLPDWADEFGMLYLQVKFNDKKVTTIASIPWDPTKELIP